jgi:glycine/D-amino acid oxidase-like deaminating enzyme
MNLSYWEKSSFLADADYVIVGAGIVGLFTAITLKKAQPLARVVLLERSFLPSGASTKNAGFACFGSISELIEQEQTCSKREFLSVIQQRWQGLNLLISTLGAEQIAFEPCGGYELFTPEESELYQACKAKINYYNDLLQEHIGASTPIFSTADERIKEFGFKGIEHLIFNAYEGKIDAGKMMQNLIAKARSLGVEIFFGAEVLAYQTQNKQVKISGEHFEINAKKILIATNAFAKQLLPNLSIVPGRGQVLITKPIQNIKFNSTFHYQKGYFYFRNIDNRILIGGGRNLFFEQEESTEMHNTENILSSLKTLLSDKICPDQPIEIDYAWSGIMAFGEQLQPIIEKIAEGVFVAVRCNGMGIAMGSKTGESLAKLALAADLNGIN